MVLAEDTAQVASGEKDGTGTGSTGDTGLLPIMQRGSGSHDICRLATISHATIQAIGMTGPGTQDAVGHDFPEPCGILGSQIARKTDAMLLETEKGDDITPDTIYNLLTDLSMNSQNTLNIKTAHAGPG